MRCGRRRRLSRTDGAPMARPALEVADIFRDHGLAWRAANAGHASLAQLRVKRRLGSRFGTVCQQQLENRETGCQLGPQAVIPPAVRLDNQAALLAFRLS